MDALVAASTMGWGWYVVSFIIWILIIAWTAAIARRKGRSPFGWGLLAFFFSLIALIVIALMPSRRV